MRVTIRGLVRTTLWSSTAGLMLGVPLLSTVPDTLRGQEHPAAPVIRGQSADDGGVISRWMGNRQTAVSQQANVATELNEDAGTSPQQRAGVVGRLLGPTTPTQAQVSKQMMRAQAKFMRRNPYAARIMMLQQQQQVLQEQQQSLEQDYEAEAVPDREVFDSLNIDPNEWADAPGRQITEQLPNPPAKPWWETGEAPNSRPRAISADEISQDAIPQTATPAQVPPPAAPAAAPVASSISDPFPSEPNTAPASEPDGESSFDSAAVSSAAPRPRQPSTPRGTPVSPTTEEFGLTFPEAATSPPPMTVVAPAVTPSPAPAVALPVNPSAPPQTAALPSGPAGFIPPEPSGDAPATAVAPAAPLAPSLSVPVPVVPDEPFFAPASPATPAVPVVPAGPEQIVTSAPSSLRVESAPEIADPAVSAAVPAMPATEPGDEFFFPPQPASPLVTESTPATTEPPAFPAETEPSGETFLPELPAEPAPAIAAEPPAAVTPAPGSADASNPFTGLTLDAAPSIAAEPAVPSTNVEVPAATTETPSASPTPVDFPEAGFSVPVEPAPEITAPSLDPKSSSFGSSAQSTIVVPNPAPFIPPDPEQFGGEYSVPEASAATPGFGEPGLAPPAVSEGIAPDEYLAPDITEWNPEPTQAPDPIVAPSTARQLVVTPPPTPEQTRLKIDRIASRKGLSGFKGFCPVSLKDHRELVDARPEHSAVYNGRRYFFSTEAAQALFESTPEAYAPAALGNDVVHLELTGESAAGSLDYAVWFRSKLYLFASAETMETFVAAPSIHAREE